MESDNLKLNKINSKIMAWSIFQFGILQPLCIIINNQIPIIISTLFIIILMFLNNNFKLKISNIFVFLIASIFFLINIIINIENTILILMIYLEFIIKGFFYFIIGSLNIDTKELMVYMKKLAVVNSIVLIPIPILGYLDPEGYMRYGYAILPSVLILLSCIFYQKNNKSIYTIIGLICLLFTIIYGSRGPIACIFIFIFCIIFFMDLSKILQKSIFLVFILVALIYIIKSDVLINTVNFLYQKLKIQTYSIEKIKMMIEQGLEASSSGRDKIYLVIFEKFKESPFYGNGIGASQFILGKGYTAHNMILQILVETGLIGMLIWICIWIYSGIKYIEVIRDKNRNFFLIVTVFISISVGRLMISSDIWLRPEYWFVLSLLINYKSKKRMV